MSFLNPSPAHHDRLKPALSSFMVLNFCITNPDPIGFIIMIMGATIFDSLIVWGSSSSFLPPTILRISHKRTEKLWRELL
ncbi:hypothetical protein K450DRAFT_222888 [Umbelopsis ramanniana AG]|uniref:Uncharacterized protein n=1 Tax=Umbelopsis ramanniana AG TaxID=1314678 RepID=A0AAD5HGA7_UMBRA|nr:uncharacterized protein K450DRAFT_222888 [Umbelopsis ramanniana AG]KAI8583290.1 hypothetical protein K450DRAFT_222888 [Umbelopsis ramanniana AG]